MKGISTKDTYEYICLEDRDLDKKDQTIFVLNYLTIEQEAHIDDKLGCVTDDGYQVSIGSTALLALHYGINEVKNLPVGVKELILARDLSKKKLKGGLRPWHLDGLSCIKKATRTELAEIIRNGGETEDEVRPEEKKE